MAKDEVQAVSWFRKAADQGHAKAQHNLGYCYDNGKGVPKDEVQAVSWYRKAAEQGYVDAQFNLALRYAQGKGVAKDEVEAVKWYRKAAEQGDAQAQNNLGVCYDKGLGVIKNEIEAYAFYNLAGITNELARSNLAILEKGMSPDARLLGQRRTIQLQKEIEGRLETLDDLRKAVERESLRKGA